MGNYGYPYALHSRRKTSTFAICLILLFCTSGSFAQSKDSTFQRFGFQIGVNLSNMNFNEGEPPPAVPANASWQAGFTFGFQLKVPLAKKWILQPEYSFSQRNGSDQAISTNYKIDYFSLPVLIAYQLSPRFNILAGPASRNHPESQLIHKRRQCQYYPRCGRTWHRRYGRIGICRFQISLYFRKISSGSESCWDRSAIRYQRI